MRAPNGNSNYNSLQADLRHNIGHGLTFEAAYTWAHTLDNIVTNGVDDANLGRWYGTSSLNQTQVLTINWVYQIPFFNKSPFAAARYILGGWQVGGIASFMTGPPIDFCVQLEWLFHRDRRPSRLRSAGQAGREEGHRRRSELRTDAVLV